MIADTDCFPLGYRSGARLDDAKPANGVRRSVMCSARLARMMVMDRVRVLASPPQARHSGSSGASEPFDLDDWGSL
jgi:hypothetical protein